MRLDSPKVKRAAGWIGAFALPLVIVQMTGWISGAGGPAQARATAPMSEQAGSPIDDSLQRIALAEGARKRLSPADRSLADHVSWLRATHFGPTPMFHAQPQRPEPSLQLVEIEGPVPARVAEDDVPNFQLQAVMSARGNAGARALINGRVIEIGEAVTGTEWVAVDINAEARRVVLEHAATARTVTLTLTLRQ